MENKIVNVVLDNIDDSIKLVFKLSVGDAELNLESDNSDEIKMVFLKLIKEIEINPIDLNLIIGDNFNVILSLKNENLISISTHQLPIKLC